MEALKVSFNRNERISITSLISYLLIICLSVLFAYTAGKKLMNMAAFQAHITLIQWIPASLASVVSWAITLLEFTLALSLLYRRSRAIASYSILLLMVLYSGYVYYILNLALFIPCSCEGAFKSLSWQGHYWVNLGVGLTVITILLLHKYQSRKEQNNHVT